MTLPGPDIFVSYKAEDRARVAPLVKALAADRMTVWWDAHIGGGANWRQEIESNLDAARCVLVVWSYGSAGPSGEFVRDEASRARRRGIYLPVRIDPVELPLGFGEVQALSLEGWKGSRKDPRYLALIESVRKVLAKEALTGAGTGPVARPVSASRRGLMLGGGALTALAATGVGGWLLFRPDEAAAAQRIAVLPFRNLSGDTAQDYFAEGIAEELRGALARVGMLVIGRTSSEAVAKLDAKEAAEKVGADRLLTGSVRKSPDTIRISAQVVDGSNGIEAWSQAYDSAPGDAIKIQTDIAEKVATALQVTLGANGRSALELGGTSDVRAQELFLQALVSPQTEPLLREALARDPHFARAWVLLATTTSSWAMRKVADTAERNMHLDRAESYLAKAQQIAPDFPFAIAASGFLDLHRLKFRAALATADRVAMLAPNDVVVLEGAVMIFRCLRPNRSALDLIDRMVSLDPLNPSSGTRRFQMLAALRRFDEAIATAQPLVAAAGSSYAWATLANLYLAKGDNAKAESLLPKFEDMPFEPILVRGVLAGRRGNNASFDEQVAAMGKFGDGASYQFAQMFAQGGKIDRAFDSLDKAVEIGDGGLLELKIDSLLDPLRGDPRFAVLVKKLDFP